MSKNDTNAILVMTTLLDQTSAEKLAHHLLEHKLAACINILSPCNSIYSWQGKVEQASEVPVLIKSTKDRYDALEAALISQHPYELPEIIHVPIAGGLPAYLNWVSEGTKP